MIFNCFLAVLSVTCEVFEMHIQYLYVPSLPSLTRTPFLSLPSLYSVLPAELCTQESCASESVVNVICFELGVM